MSCVSWERAWSSCAGQGSGTAAPLSLHQSEFCVPAWNYLESQSPTILRFLMYSGRLWDAIACYSGLLSVPGRPVLCTVSEP